jgi:hypothetical protein
LEGVVEAEGEAAQAGGEVRAQGVSVRGRLHGGVPSGTEGRLHQRVVFDLSYAVAQDELGLIERW